MKRFVQKIFNFLGLHISKFGKRENVSFYDDYNKKIGYEFEKEANEVIKIVRKQTMLPYINLVTLYEQVLHCERNNIEGDFIECGVWKGGAIGLMAFANMQYSRQRRTLHLFDVFDDISAPDEIIDGKKAIEDIKELAGVNANIHGELKSQKGIYDKFGGHGTIEECQFLIEKIINYPENKVNYHKGWFQETLPEKANSIDKIAILRLDGDWYASTKICLEYLFDKVVPGGFIIIDDYGLYSGCKKAVDEFLKKQGANYYINYSSWACRYIIK
jgi:O-methyltransferase